MTTEQSLIPVRGGLTPQIFRQALVEAHEKAKALADIVEKQKLYVQIGTSKHLRIEAWQTIGMAYEYTARTHKVVPVKDESGNVGAKAEALVYDALGTVRGGAESYCFSTEDGHQDQPFAQLAGMAQTRAAARGLRQILAWVVVLAGYSPTPAEEMQAQTTVVAKGQTTMLTHCSEHGKPWREGKYGPYHGIEGGGFCNQRQVFGGLLEKATKELVWGKPTVTDWLRAGYGATWSKLSPEQQVDAIHRLEALTLDSQEQPQAPEDEVF